MGYGGIDVDDLNEERAERDAARAQLAEVTRERDEARADDAKLGAAVRAVLDMFMWDHSTVRAEVESDRLAETVEGCIFVAIERAIRPADFVPARDAKTIGRISRLVGPPRCEACIREGRYTPCLECPEPGTPSGWVSGGGTSEVK